MGDNDDVISTNLRVLPDPLLHDIHDPTIQTLLTTSPEAKCGEQVSCINILKACFF